MVPHFWQHSGWVYSMDCHVSITFSPSFLHGLICCSLGLSSACLVPSQDCSPLTHFFCHCATCHRVQVRNIFACTQIIGMIFICCALYCMSQNYSMESLVNMAPPPTVWGSLTLSVTSVGILHIWSSTPTLLLQLDTIGHIHIFYPHTLGHPSPTSHTLSYPSPTSHTLSHPSPTSHTHQ